MKNKFTIYNLQFTNVRGFTLIEMLVVVSIIGILATLIFVSFSGAQREARNSVRKSDLKQYQNSLEVYANRSNGFYPSRTDATGVSAFTALCSDLSLTSCPEDPRNADDGSFQYRYQSNGSGGSPTTATATDYVLWAKQESGSTTSYIVYCSNGKTGEVTAGIPPSGGACPI